MRVTILGPFEARSDAGDCLPVAGARLRDLITRLALAGGKPVSTSALAEAVWGDQPPADLANALQTLVSRARRALGGPAAIEQSPAGYRLAVTPDDVDALRFERLVADGHVEEALALWRGPALEDAGEFAVPYARRLEELKLNATVTWLTRELATGRAAAHVAGLEALAAESPLNEKVTALLMRALAATGRQAAALAVYEALRARLADELGIDPGPQLQAIHLEVLRGKVEASDAQARGAAGYSGAARGSRRTSLRTPLTSFIGREDEVGRVGKALVAYRLVTLVGPGGAGKTRLATEVAAQVAAGGAAAPEPSPGADGGAVAVGELAPDGVWMAELASVTDAADVPQAVLGSIGLRESRIMLDGSQRVTTRDAQTRLLDGLADAQALLVLDNCEHLIDACAHLADTLLAHSPGLRIVATSREPLGIVGESLLVVPPLAQDPAVRLFADRAAAVSPGFTVNEENLPLVTDIVRRLDGLPLAIELAAARLRTLPLAEISRRLDDRFRLLTGGSRTALPRHRTLRAVVEWSWDLLSPAERLLTERFSVFPAGATPEAVAEVCGDHGDADRGDIDDLLSSLVDKSLLQPVDGGARLRMLETIREYGAEKLAERAVRGAPELDEVRRRHATYYSDLMHEAMPKLLTRDQLRWLQVVQADRDNILAALHYWCDEQDAARAIALAVPVACLAFLLGNQADIKDLIGPAVTVPGDADPDLRTMADALHVITLAVHPGALSDPAEEELGFPGLADRVEALGFEKFPMAGLLRPAYAMFTQDIERARRYVDEALASQDEWLVAATWMIAAALAENSGDLDTLRSAAAQALDRFRALGERWGLSSALRIVGSVRILDGDLDGAVAAFSEAGQVLAEIGSRDDESHMRLQLADIAARRGDLVAAREFYQTALEAAKSDGSGMDAVIVSAGFAMFEVMVGNVEQARHMRAAAEQGLVLLSPVHPARHHLLAVTAVSGLIIALADGDLPLAREHAASMYREGIASDDMPLLASVGGALAHLALELGQPERAAEILGACVAVRGGEDLTDLTVTQLGPRLREALGPDGYDRAYAAGMALDRPEALALLDPATLGLSPQPGDCLCTDPLPSGRFAVAGVFDRIARLPTKGSLARRSGGTQMNVSGSPRPTRRGVLKAGLVATAVAGTGAWAMNPGDGPIRQPGSLPFPKLAPGTDTIPQVEHIVVIMQENHSYDNRLGMLRRPGADGFRLGPDGLPLATNPYPDGSIQHAFRMPTTCQLGSRPSQEWTASHNAYDNGKMDGFVRTPIDPLTTEIVGGVAMGYWQAEDQPFYDSIYRHFPIADRYFCSVLGQTFPNRRYLLAATSLGQIDDLGVSLTDYPANGTIFDQLDAHGITWKDYFTTTPSTELFPKLYLDNKGTKVAPITDFFTDVAAGTLPNYCLVEPDYGNQSEENPQNIAVGEEFAASVINAVINGPDWDRTLLILTYDEHGGYYDHVPPPAAIPPDSIGPTLLPGEDGFDGFARYGFRVPFAIVSPWARRHYVSHRVFDHTSILKLVETKWNLPALTYRDANAAPMLDMLDFRHPAFAEPPHLAQPLAVTDPASLSCSVNGPGTIPPPGSISSGK